MTIMLLKVILKVELAIIIQFLKLFFHLKQSKCYQRKVKIQTIGTKVEDDIDFNLFYLLHKRQKVKTFISKYQSGALYSSFGIQTRSFLYFNHYILSE